MSKTLDYFAVNSKDFDPKRFIVQDPLTHTYKTNGKNEVRSYPVYLDDKGKECIPVFQLPERSTAGVYPTYKYSCPETPEFHDGYNVGYSMTSQDTMKKPTSDEKSVKKLFDGISQNVYDVMSKESESKRSILPMVSKTAIAMAKMEKGNIFAAVKCPYAHPNKKDPESKGDKAKKIPDKSKPQVTYLKLQAFGQGSKLKNSTDIFGPGDLLLDPSACKKPGIITPMVIITSVYYGAHGKDSTCGASVRYKIYEMKYTSTVKEHKRLIGRNTAPVREEESEEEKEQKSSSSENEEGSSSEDDDFKDPEVKESDSEEDSPPPKRRSKSEKSEKTEKASKVSKKPAKASKAEKPTKVSKKPAKVSTEKTAKEKRRELIAEKKKKLSKK